MTYVIIHALAPIFVIMLLGFWAGKAKMVDNKNVSLLNIFVMDFALPAALFSATVQTPWAGIVAQSPLIVVLTGLAICLYYSRALDAFIEGMTLHFVVDREPLSREDIRAMVGRIAGV